MNAAGLQLHSEMPVTVTSLEPHKSLELLVPYFFMVTYLILTCHICVDPPRGLLSFRFFLISVFYTLVVSPCMLFDLSVSYSLICLSLMTYWGRTNCELCHSAVFSFVLLHHLTYVQIFSFLSCRKSYCL